MNLQYQTTKLLQIHHANELARIAEGSYFKATLKIAIQVMFSANLLPLE
jgi:hypothetical protein